MTSSPRWEILPEAPAGTPIGLRTSDRDVDALAQWLTDNRGEVHERLVRHGAIHVRGADAGDAVRFERVLRGFTQDLKNDYLGTSPRDAVTDYVFHASELPGFYPIPQHIEMSFTRHPPTWLFFGCTLAPARFGETPVADFRAVARDLDRGVRERFVRRQLRVVRNYGPPDKVSRDLWQLKPWSDMFGTTDRAAVEARCAEEGFEPTWRADGGLRLTSYHAPFQAHPETGEEVWFNHLQVFHLSTAVGEYKRITKLRPSLRHAGLLAFAAASTWAKSRRTAPDDQAMHCTYGDGAPIPAADVEAVRDAVWKHTVRIPWQVGDVLMIDNRSTSHGRMPYRGPREVIVGWA